MKSCLLPLVAVLLTAGLAHAQVTPDALQAESEAKAVATASIPATPEQIIAKVGDAAAFLEKEGLPALAKLQGKDSDYIFGGTYIWVHAEDGTMVMHPLKPKMDGKNVHEVSDSNGKLFFIEMTNQVKSHGQGWIDYTWPKPGEKSPSHKISYVKGAKIDGKLYILGCGVYDYTDDKIAALKAAN